VIFVQLEADIMAKPVTATAGIYQTNSYAESQKVNPEVDRDRLCWDINVYSDALTGTNDPKRTGELLENMQLAALRAREMQIAGQAKQQLDELKKTGKLNPDGVTKMLRDSRKLGGDA
jgi:Ca-activated chloride channel family protein